MRIAVIDPAKGETVTVGEWEDGIFTKVVDSRKHKLKIFPGYGISQEALQEIMNHNPQSLIRIVEKDTGIEYRSRLSDWTRKGVLKDLGHGPQVFLSLEQMNR